MMKIESCHAHLESRIVGLHCIHEVQWRERHREMIPARWRHIQTHCGCRRYTRERSETSASHYKPSGGFLEVLGMTIM